MFPTLICQNDSSNNFHVSRKGNSILGDCCLGKKGIHTRGARLPATSRILTADTYFHEDSKNRIFFLTPSWRATSAGYVQLGWLGKPGRSSTSTGCDGVSNRKKYVWFWNSHENLYEIYYIGQLNQTNSFKSGQPWYILQLHVKLNMNLRSS